MVEVRLKASDPRYKEYNDIWNSYAQSKNPHIWLNIRNVPLEFLLQFQDEMMTEMERLLK